MRILHALFAWLPLLVMSALALWSREQLPPWAMMWLLVAALFAGSKWLIWWRYLRHDVPLWKQAGYLLAAPGMDPAPFKQPRADAPALDAEKIWAALVKMLLGGAALAVAVQYAAPERQWPAWLGAAGVLMLLHFGLLHFAAQLWNAAGVPVEPVMDRPLLSTSLSDFWSRRWNRAFSYLAHILVLRPLERRGVNRWLAIGGVFLVSGLLHELLISYPARAGYGLPTLYFMLQAFGLYLERTSLGRRFMRGGIPGWLSCLLIIGVPVYWLFHPAFMQSVITSFFVALRGLIPESPPDLVTLIRVAGLLHFSILIASALVPKVLDWEKSLMQVNALARHVIWVHGVFIVLVIIGFGALSLGNAEALGSGTPLARSLCAFIALFWGARLGIQLFLFDIRAHVQNAVLRAGFHALTGVFTVLTTIYGTAALL